MGISSHFPSFSLMPTPHKLFAQPSLPVEDWYFPSPYSMRLRTCFSHNPSALHSPFPLPCASRGKPRSLNTPSIPVFQNSRIAQPLFRKLSTTPTPLPTITSEAFPLFLTELRVLLSFSLISYPFPTTRRACQLYFQSQRPNLAPAPAKCISSRQILTIPVIQRTTLFSTRTK
jgi:hypothetical protein